MLDLVLTTSPPAGSTTATMNIVNRSVSAVAPEGIVFGLDLSNFDTAGPASISDFDDRLQEIYCFWDFDDDYSFTAPTNVSANHKRAGVGYGVEAAHVYRSPGTYNPSCFIVESSSGKTATATMQVVIGDQDTLFAGANTLFVDLTYAGTEGATSGGTRPAEAPTGSAVYSSFDLAYNAMKNVTLTTPKRLMLARDQVHTPTSLGAVGYSFNMSSHCIVAAGGAGAKPELILTSTAFIWAYTDVGSRSDKDWWFENIKLSGTWDTTTATGARVDLVTINEYPAIQTLFDQCEFTGMNLGILMGADPSTYTSSETPHIFVNDCAFTDYRSSCIFGNYINMMLLGSSLVQNPDALAYYFIDASDPNQALISCIRFEHMDRQIVAQNDFFSKTGWGGKADDGYADTQACIRGLSKAHEGAYLHYWGNVCEGGFGVLAVTESDGATSLPIRALIEMNYCIGSFDSRRILDFAYGGVIVRNNILVCPDSQRVSGAGDFWEMVTFDVAGGGSSAANTAAPMMVYNNTMINLLSDANATGGSAQVALEYRDAHGYSDVTVENNMFYQASAGNTADGPFDTSPQWTPRLKGYLDYIVPLEADKATPAGTPVLGRPQAGSAANDSATTGLTAYTDFYGAERVGLISRGALESV